LKIKVLLSSMLIIYTKEEIKIKIKNNGNYAWLMSASIENNSNYKYKTV